jgi:hypothetical protein
VRSRLQTVGESQPTSHGTALARRFQGIVMLQEAVSFGGCGLSVGPARGGCRRVSAVAGLFLAQPEHFLLLGGNEGGYEALVRLVRQSVRQIWVGIHDGILPPRLNPRLHRSFGQLDRVSSGSVGDRSPGGPRRASTARFTTTRRRRPAPSNRTTGNLGRSRGSRRSSLPPSHAAPPQCSCGPKTLRVTPL